MCAGACARVQSFAQPRHAWGGGVGGDGRGEGRSFDRSFDRSVDRSAVARSAGTAGTSRAPRRFGSVRVASVARAESRISPPTHHRRVHPRLRHLPWELRGEAAPRERREHPRAAVREESFQMRALPELPRLRLRASGLLPGRDRGRGRRRARHLARGRRSEPRRRPRSSSRGRRYVRRDGERFIGMDLSRGGREGGECFLRVCPA